MLEVYGILSTVSGSVSHNVQPRLCRMTEPPPLRLARSIVMVGLMGAGKTSIGKRLAQKLLVPFVDSDVEIEKAANETIAEIFARDGEAAFRAGERRVIARLLDGPIHVLATGGGAFMDPATRTRIRERGVSVWLRADLETLLERTSRRHNRPLLQQGDPRTVLSRLIETRYPIYAEADLVIDSVPGPSEATVQKLLVALNQWAEPSGIVDRQAQAE
jgi:shikimate kinase